MFNKILGNKKNRSLHLMILPAVVLVFIFVYVPLFGNVMAFQNYIPSKGIFRSEWVGLDNFIFLFSLPNFWQVIFNTFYISLMKIVACIVIPVIFALMLNEVRMYWLKSVVQTSVYLPHFLSWVIMAGILIDILSPADGVISMLLGKLGVQMPFLLGDPKLFPYTMVLTDLIKEFGFESIVYLAALSAIDPTLYEAASVDGANRWKKTWHITLPSLIPIITLMTTLSMGYVFTAGFDQIFNMLNPNVMQTGDILDTFIYRLGFLGVQYSIATAAGIFKTVVSFIFIAVSYKIASKYLGYEVF